MTENSKLKQAVIDAMNGDIGLIDIMVEIDRAENKLEIYDLMIELILKYISGLQKGEPNHYLAHSIDYWRSKAQKLQTERLSLEKNLEIDHENKT